MTSIPYDTIYSSFLGEITDYSFVNRAEVESYELMHELLQKILARPYVKRLFITSKLDDDNETFVFVLRYSTDEDSDKDFVMTVLAKWMSFQWSENKVKSIENTAQFFGTKEQKLKKLNQLSQFAIKETI